MHVPSFSLAGILCCCIGCSIVLLVPARGVNNTGPRMAQEDQSCWFLEGGSPQRQVFWNPCRLLPLSLSYTHCGCPLTKVPFTRCCTSAHLLAKSGERLPLERCLQPRRTGLESLAYLFTKSETLTNSGWTEETCVNLVVCCCYRPKWKGSALLQRRFLCGLCNSSDLNWEGNAVKSISSQQALAQMGYSCANTCWEITGSFILPHSLPLPFPFYPSLFVSPFQRLLQSLLHFPEQSHIYLSTQGGWNSITAKRVCGGEGGGVRGCCTLRKNRVESFKEFGKKTATRILSSRGWDRSRSL